MICPICEDSFKIIEYQIASTCHCRNFILYSNKSSEPGFIAKIENAEIHYYEKYSRVKIYINHCINSNLNLKLDYKNLNLNKFKTLLAFL